MERGIKAVPSTEEDKKYRAYKPWKVVEDGLNYSFHDTEAEAQEAANAFEAEEKQISEVEDAVDIFLNDLAMRLGVSTQEVKQKVINYLT